MLVLSLFWSGNSFAASAETGAAASPAAEWSLEAQITVSDSEAAEIGMKVATQRSINALVSKLKSKGITVEKKVIGSDEKGVAYALTASGKGTVGSFREFLYSTAKPEFNVLGGVTEMTIESPPANGEVVVVLESNPSTGYRWHVTADSGMTTTAANVYETHTRGYGVPQRQIISLAPRGAGNQTVKLLYGRSWENEPVARQIRLKVSSMSSKLDLSNPLAPQGEASVPAGAVKTEIFPKVKTALPASFDWRNQNIVPAVRNQGNCGSCWSFGTVGIMESALAKTGQATKAIDLSEQYLISCNESGWDCDGGLTAHIYHYDTAGMNQGAPGAVLESVKPYTESNGTCPTNYAKPYILDSWQFVTGSEWTIPTVDQIKSAIYTYGPITAGVCAGDGWDTYSNGVFRTNETSQCGGSTNHQIILVGWNNNNGGYWILRNSWGPNWGIAGYMNIGWGISRVGEGTSWVTTEAPTCAYSITSSSSVTLNFNGGSTVARITASGGTGCPQPTVTPTEAWLTYSNVTWRNNRGTVKITAAANTSSVERGPVTVDIGGAALSVTQRGRPCTMQALNPPRASFDANAHPGNTFAITTNPADCSWTAAVDGAAAAWLQITSGAFGAGPGTVTYDVSSNAGKARVGKINVILEQKNTKKVFTVTQRKP
jgi:inhibitor of cysteine peptidase